MNKINEYKIGFRNYEEHTPAGAKIIFNMICKEYERKIFELEKRILKMDLDINAESHNHEYTKYLLKEMALKFEIVTGQTNKAQKDLLKLYEDFPDFLSRKNADNLTP